MVYLKFCRNMLLGQFYITRQIAWTINIQLCHTWKKILAMSLTRSNARQFYLSNGDPLGLKGYNHRITTRKSEYRKFVLAICVYAQFIHDSNDISKVSSARLPYLGDSLISFYIQMILLSNTPSKWIILYNTYTTHPSICTMKMPISYWIIIFFYVYMKPVQNFVLTGHFYFGMTHSAITLSSSICNISSSNLTIPV